MKILFIQFRMPTVVIKRFINAIIICSIFTPMQDILAQGDGFLTKDERRLFPIGIYEFPKTDGELKAIAEAGINLIRYGSKEDLDRAASVGLMGWLPIAVNNGPTDDLRKKIESVVNHPALAVWEGPDEIVWNFTAYSGLYREKKVYKQSGEWWLQTPLAIHYSEEQAKEVIPKMKEGINLVRRLDMHNRQFWINEARDSDLKFIRQYIDFVDITGCDHYPVGRDQRDAYKLGASTERFLRIGRGKPVWMVLQAFSWHELGERYSDRGVAYPTFDESRLMAYDCIARGARGILYWGSMFLKSAEFRESLYALTGEIAQLQPFLTASDERNVRVQVIEGRGGQKDSSEYLNQSIVVAARRTGRDWLIILVNETGIMQYGIEVSGLDDLNGMDFHLLYGNETVTINRGEFVTRMKPFSVKVFATSRKWEIERRKGREFGQ